jgi:hypothetical protein
VEVLQQELERGRRAGSGLDPVTTRFRKRVAKALQAPWNMAAGEDLLWPGVEGPRPPAAALMNWYFSRVHQLSARDPAALRSFLEVMNMRKPLRRIFAPRVLLGVLGSTLRSS